MAPHCPELRDEEDEKRQKLLDAVFKDPSCGVAQYADAARALSVSRAPSGVDRLKLCYALLNAGEALVPSPAPLVLRHVLYVLTVSSVSGDKTQQDFPPSIRADYWKLLPLANAAVGACAELPHAISDAAAATFCNTSDVQVHPEVAAALLQLPTLPASLEARAALTGAACQNFCSSKCPKYMHPLIVRLLREYDDAQRRCNNFKKVFVALMDHVLEHALELLSYTDLFRSATSVMRYGLFSSPAPVLDHNSYFSDLYQWIEQAPVHLLPSAVPMMLEGCYIFANGGDGAESAESEQLKDVGDPQQHRKFVGKKRKIDHLQPAQNQKGTRAQKKDDPCPSLPVHVRIPLFLLQRILHALLSVLAAQAKKFAEQTSLIGHIFEAFAKLLDTAARLNIYRLSFDPKPASGVRKPREASINNTDKPIIQSGENGPVASVSRMDIVAVGPVIGSSFRAIVQQIMGLRITLTDSPELSDNIGTIIDGGCAALRSAIQMSLDSVAPDMTTCIQMLAQHATAARGKVLDSLAALMISLIHSYADIRQLPELFSSLVSTPGLLRDLVRLFQLGSTRDAIVNVIASAPRGHPASCIRSLIPTGGFHQANDATAFVVICVIILESAPTTEHQEFAKILEQDVLFAVLQAYHNTRIGAIPELLCLRASILYIMASAGVPLTSDLFASSLFRAGQEAVESDDYSSPDSDSSDYDAEDVERMRILRKQKWTKSGRVQRVCRIGKVNDNRRKYQLVHLEVMWLLLRLRFFSALAQICANDHELSASLAANTLDQTFPARCSVELEQQSEISQHNALQVVIQECLHFIGRADMTLLIPGLSKEFGAKCVDGVKWRENEDPRMPTTVLDESMGARMTFSIQRLEWRLSVMTRTVGNAMINRYIQIGVSIVEVMSIRGIENFPNCSSPEDANLTLRGLRNIIAACLAVNVRIGFAWQVLWESNFVRENLIDVLEHTVRTWPRHLISGALQRCAGMPPRYLRKSGENEIRLSRLCAELASGQCVDDTCKHALAILSKRNRFGSDISKVGSGVWINRVALFEGSENILLSLDQSDDGSSTHCKLLRRIRKRSCRDLVGMAWMLRSIAIFIEGGYMLENFEHAQHEEGYDVAVRSFWKNEILVTLGCIVCAVENRIGNYSNNEEHDTMFLCMRDVNRFHQALESAMKTPACHWLPANRKSGISPESGLPAFLEQCRVAVGRIVRLTFHYALCSLLKSHFSNTAITASNSVAIEAVCSSFVGDRPSYALAFKGEQPHFGGPSREFVLNALSAVSLKWLSCNETSWQHAGASLLEAVAVNSSFDRSRDIADAISMALLTQLRRGRFSAVRATSVLLRCAQSRHVNGLATESSRTALAFLRGNPWEQGNTIDDRPGANAEMLDSIKMLLAGLEEWARNCRTHRGSRPAPKNIESVLQMFAMMVRIPSFRSYRDGELLCGCLSVCAILIKQSISAPGAKINSIAHAAKLLTQSILLGVPSVSDRIFSSSGRVHTLLASLGNRELARAALFDVCIAVARSQDAHVRRAALAGVGDLLEVLRTDETVRTLRDLPDDAKEVLHALRDEYLSEEKYRGRI